MKARGMSVKKKDEEDEGVADPDGTRRGLMKKEGGRVDRDRTTCTEQGWMNWKGRRNLI